MDFVPACIALGSNVGDRRAHLAAAVDAIARLPATSLLVISSFIETDPVIPPGMPARTAGGTYLNAAAAIRTSLPPRRLLDALLAIERSRGRDRSSESRWGARTLDLDLLLYGDLVIDEPGLTIPHPRLHERRFVLAPLAQVAPDARVPGLGRTVADLLAALGPDPALRPSKGPAARRALAPMLAVAASAVMGIAGPAPAAAAPRPLSPQAQPRPSEFPIEVALKALHDAYHQRPFAERVTVTARRGGSPPAERRDEAVIRYHPGRAPGDEHDGPEQPRLLLALGGLRIAAAGTTLVAVHERDAGTCFRIDDPAGVLSVEALSRLLPPLPFPQIDLALSSDLPPRRLTPYADAIRWESAVLDDADAPTRLTILGSASGRRVQVVIDPATGRLREFSLALGAEGSPSGTLDLRCAPLDLAPDTAWEIPTDGRARVESFADLRARPGDLRPGDTIPNLALSFPDGRAWSIAEDLAPLAAEHFLEGDRLPPAPCLLLLLVRQPSAGSPRSPDEPALAAAIRAASAIVRESTSPRPAAPAPGPDSTPAPSAPVPPRCALRTALVFEAPGRDLAERVRAAVALWSQAGPALWTASPATTLDRLDPAASAAIAVIDANRTLRAVIPLGPDAAPDDLRRRLEQALGVPHQP
jgi:2-amino-4-hydroxy-6-hydroxymethyldihydropteridine diphosphokinase